MKLAITLSSSIFFASFLVLLIIPTGPIVGGLLALANLFSLAGMIACLSVLVTIHRVMLSEQYQVAYSIVSRRPIITHKKGH